MLVVHLDPASRETNEKMLQMEHTILVYNTHGF